MFTTQPSWCSMVGLVQDLKSHPSPKDIMTWLEDVPDPEIPVISVVDLGIIRNVEWVDDILIVHITPTYSGCPATSAIAIDIETTLRAHGVNKININRQLSPPWTTDWLTDGGREKLKAYGIAPPACEALGVGMLRPEGMAKPDIVCPRCDSTQTECISQFGSTPCKASYRCRDCREPFDYFKSF